MPHSRARPGCRVMVALVALGALVMLADPARGAEEETAERFLIAKLNTERHAAGLPPLVVHDRLSRAARAWSSVMQAEGRLSHDPRLADHLDAGWRRVGETVANGRQEGAGVEEIAARVHELFMGSPAHRSVILGSWHHVGLGVRRSADGTMWVTVAFAAVGELPPVPAGARNLATGACPVATVPRGRFGDVAGNVHARAVECLAWYEITAGSDGGRAYRPREPVTRAQMAGFLARTVDRTTGRQLPAEDATRFRDVGADHTFASAISRLAAAGIVRGGPAGRPADEFAPESPVTRAQMAAFLDRAYTAVVGRSLPRADACFPDTAAHVLRRSIDRLCLAGVVEGTSSGHYRPGAPVRRDAMASFVVRLLDVLLAENAAAQPSPEGATDPPAGE